MNHFFKNAPESTTVSKVKEDVFETKNSRMDSTCNTTDNSKGKSGETHAFCIFSFLIFFLVIANFALALLILRVLRIGYGMESIELNSAEQLINFYGNIDLDRLYKADGKLSGFKDAPVEISGLENSVWIDLLEHLNNKTPVQHLHVEKNGTHVKNVSNFEVVNPTTGNKLFSTGFPNFRLPHRVSKMDVGIVHTHRIASPINTTLYLRSETVTRLKGNEGTRMSGKNVMWTADGDIFVKSVNGSLILSGKNGVVMDLKSLHVSVHKKPNRTISTHYKLCVCMPEGKVFKIPVTQRQSMSLACHFVDRSAGKSPC